MKSIIFHGTPADVPYLPQLKPLLAGRATTYIDTQTPTTAYEYVLKSKERGNATVVTTSQHLLSLIYPDAKNPKINDYAGSLINYKGTDFLFIDPLEQLITVPHGKFVCRRFLDKVLRPEMWIPTPPFRWELFSAQNTDSLIEFFSSCILIANDIETRIGDPERRIRCVGFCGIILSKGQITMRTVVVPLETESTDTNLYNLAFIRVVNSLPAAKVFQNGKYDNAYYMRYGSPVTNYTFDTINMFHCWFSELPKDLGFISCFMLREYSYHKDDGDSGGLIGYYGYNAKDVYTTVLTCLAILLEAPAYQETNYLQEFPLVFPCILSEQTGIRIDPVRFAEQKQKVVEQQAATLKKLQTMLAWPSFNPGSWQQVAKVFAMLGSKDVVKTGPAEKDKVASRHPLNELIVNAITSYREDGKLNGSYFKDGVEWLGRCYYALNPHGTDTGRLASRESQYWCGLQVQNIPRDGDEGEITVKESFISDSGFYIGEADYSQAEARDIAYLSGDTNLISAVDDITKDFHGTNASKFFGVPYDSIVRSASVIDQDGNVLEWVHKTVDKALRDLAKRTNHGANYNMGPQVMLDTMGIKKVLRAKQLLKLPGGWSSLKVTTHLLQVYSDTYPVVKGAYYQKIIDDATMEGELVGPTGWTRKTFLQPKKSKPHLNSLVAHPSQSLNAMTLNRAYMRVFYNVYLPNPTNFKLHAQIHDSILFSYRIGFEHLAWQVKEQMCIPTEVTDTFGITRTLTVPVDLKGNATRWSEVSAMKKAA